MTAMSIMNSFQMDNVNKESQQKKSMYIQNVFDKQEGNLKILKKKFMHDKNPKNLAKCENLNNELDKINNFLKYRKRMYDFKENLE